MRTRIAILLMLLAAAGLQGADLSTPEGTASAAMAAMAAQDFQQYSLYMHPAALADFKRTMMEVVESAAEAKGEAQLLALFDGVNGLDGLRKLDDRQFFTSFLDGVMTKIPMMKEALSGADMQMLGHVMEGEVAHVVARVSVKMQGASIKKMSVVSLQKDGGEWKMLLTGELEGFARMLKARQSHD